MNYQYNPALNLSVVVPKSPNKTSVVFGSGIVAAELDGAYRVYFEGNIYGAVNLHTITERLQIAAGRLLCKYPTIAKQILSTEEFNRHFECVGTYCYQSNELDIKSSEKEQWEAWVSLYDNRRK